MIRKNLPLSKEPESYKANTKLVSTGLSFEYFPAFFQRDHDFHTHEFIEMVFVIDGTFRHVTADQTYDETTGGLTILNYNQFHTLKTPNGSVELMNLYWNPKKYPRPRLPEPFETQLDKLIPAHPMLGHRLNRTHHLQFAKPEKVIPLLRQLYGEQQNSDVGSEMAIDALFRLLLIELCRAAPALPEKNKPHFNPRMEDVRNYLEKNYTTSIRLEVLCKISHLKKANLCRQFKTYTGLTTGDYLKQRRLAEALQKLRTTNEKVLTICHDCGFSDIAHFNRAFRAAFGQTPSEYRRVASS